MDSFEKWFGKADGSTPNGLAIQYWSRAAFIAGLRRATEIATDENCDQTEYRCLTVQRIGEAIEREASNLERKGV